MISNWAVIKCRFADDVGPVVRSDADYLDLFTGSGVGTHNMVDYFRDASHGSLDLSGSKVFGWFTIPTKRAEYRPDLKAPTPPLVNRDGLVAVCRKAALDAGIDLSGFAGVMITMNGAVDLFGYVGGMTAFCSSDNLEPSLLAQEMGHGYGLDHSRREGSAVDYQDVFDTMSTASALEAVDPRWDHIGPGLNAANMRGRGWLDDTRVWRASGAAAAVTTTITLRPLHRHDLPGNLAAELPSGQLVEFRIPAGWDHGLPGARVLVHEFWDNHSYLMTSTSGKYALEVGDEFRVGDGPDGSRTSIKVASIDVNAEEATLELNYSFVIEPVHVKWPVPIRLTIPELVAQAKALLDNGRFIPVPGKTAGVEILRPLSVLGAAEDHTDLAVRTAVRRSAWTDIAAIAARELAAFDALRTPAPRPDNQI
jgi:hypothetical protein